MFSMHRFAPVCSELEAVLPMKTPPPVVPNSLLPHKDINMTDLQTDFTRER